MNQLYICYTYSPLSESPSHPTPIPSLQVITEHQAELPVLYRRFPLAICFTHVLVVQLCPTVCNPMDSSPSGSSVHGILQTRIMEWVASPFSRGSSRPRDRTCVSCIAGRFFTTWATREAPPHTQECIQVNATLSIHPIFPSPHVQKSVLYIHVFYSCPANRCSTIFLFDTIFHVQCPPLNETEPSQ